MGLLVDQNQNAEAFAGGLCISRETREVWLRGEVVHLSKLEFDLLAALSLRPKAVLSAEQLLQAIWGGCWYGGTHAIEVHISRLRRRLGESGSRPRYIETSRGVGYRFNPSPGRKTWELIYDKDLILRILNPSTVFLGWEPNAVINTFFLLAAEEHVNQSQATAIATAQAFVAAGLRRVSGPMLARTASGDFTQVEAELNLLVASEGEFLGLRGTVSI